MDNWKIQLFVVIFCALVQIYQGLSSTAGEERGLSEDWQVSIYSEKKNKKTQNVSRNEIED